MNKHTPGPWKAEADDDYEYGPWIVTTKDVLGAVAYAISEPADAHLIAAAPDLLDAAKQAVVQKGDWLAALGRAIAKAEERESA